MLTKTAVTLATALILGAASVALADNDEPNYGSRSFGNGGYATQGVNPAFHARAAANCAQRYKSFDPSTMTFLGKDGKRHPCH